jgi:hypothetical protein
VRRDGARALERYLNGNDTARQTTPPDGTDESPEGALRVYAPDHQPIRLLAELEGITPAERVHRSLGAYLDAHG